jgi:hypothetical protein
MADKIDPVVKVWAHHPHGVHSPPRRRVHALSGHLKNALRTALQAPTRSGFCAQVVCVCCVCVCVCLVFREGTS